MPSISSAGLGSGLDINGIVASLVAAERAPRADALTREATSNQAQLSAFGSLRSSLDSFNTSLEALKDIEVFQKRNFSIAGDGKDFFSVSGDNTAAPGKYDVEVLALAQHHKIASATYTDNETAIGIGTLDFTVDGETFSVDILATIDDGDGGTKAGNTVEAIRDAINNAEDNVGVTATIVEDDNGSHLVLSSNETGVINEITVAVTADAGDGLLGLAFDPTLARDPVTGDFLIPNPMAEKTRAADSKVDVDGFIKSSSDLTIEGIIQGVTLTLKDTNDVGTKHELTVALDKTATKNAINRFVSSYNALVGNINALTSYDAETKSSGLLQGDSTVRMISTRIRSEINSVIEAAVSKNIDTLAELGITSDYETGELEVDNEKLTELLDDDFDAIGSLFSGDEGLAKNIINILDPFLKSDGVLDLREDGFKSSIERVNTDFEALNRRMESVEARYQAQFFAMDALVAELSSSGDFLNTALQGVSAIINYKK
ncbi:MAG: flagellar filament capping protein FliD [Pseudomonadales bacterium]|nr:flagellar filament capping protein FliD [Pseudomonadales bacterium]